MRSKDAPIIVEQTFDAHIKKVWNAITNLDQMKQWFFENIKSFNPEVGFETQFEVNVQERKFISSENSDYSNIKVNQQY